MFRFVAGEARHQIPSQCRGHGKVQPHLEIMSRAGLKLVCIWNTEEGCLVLSILNLRSFKHQTVGASIFWQRLLSILVPSHHQPSPALNPEALLGAALRLSLVLCVFRRLRRSEGLCVLVGLWLPAQCTPLDHVECRTLDM